MQSPTHVELTILEAKGLLLRGKYDTNDAFVTIVLGKSKFQTSVIERGVNPFVWTNETFLLEIPRKGNTAVITLCVYHRRVLGHECLGTASIYLKDFQPTLNPKLMTYDLENKKSMSAVPGQITVSIVFKQIVFSASSAHHQQHKSMKLIAKELMQSQQDHKPKRAMSIRSIAQALLTEKRSQCTKAALSPGPIKKLDSNENEIKAPNSLLRQNSVPAQSGTKTLTVPENPQLVRIQSARGKINARREIQRSMERIYITQKVVPRPSSPDSSPEGSEDESEQEEPEKVEIEKLERKSLPAYEINEVPPRRNTAPSSTTKIQDDLGRDLGLPVEFQGETKLGLIELIFQLRKIVHLQQTRIDDLEDYIDGRLAIVMAKNPGALELEDENQESESRVTSSQTRKITMKNANH